MTSPFWRHTHRQISISTKVQSTDNNCTRMEHLLLSAITIGSNELTTDSSQLGDKLVMEANQSRSSIDRWGNAKQGFPFGGKKSGNKMIIDFGRNADEKI